MTRNSPQNTHPLGPATRNERGKMRPDRSRTAIHAQFPVLPTLLLIALHIPLGCNKPHGNDDAPAASGTASGTDVEHAVSASDASERPRETDGAATETSVEDLLAQRERLDQEVWADEVRAQDFERFFIQLWDRLRSASDQAAVLAETEFQSLAYRALSAPQTREHAILYRQGDGEATTLRVEEWRNLLATLADRGFRIVETEWHHSAFHPDPETPRSDVSFVLHVLRQPADASAQVTQRIIVRGILQVAWDANAAEPTPTELSVSNLEVLERTGPPAFRPVLTYQRRPEQFASAHPILVHDLDHNGYPEIIISRWNRIYWNDGPGKFREGRFLEQYVPIAEAGILADVTQDGHTDFVTVDKRGQVLVFAGTEKGTFPGTGQPAAAGIHVPDALAITAGDIDGDQDLDLWVTQYRPSYLEGQMPTPYYDANDGRPAFLLINDGRGNFTDRTEQAGLAQRRHRRTYSSSFIDYDGDHDQDLIVISDYAGVDLYQNQGDGTFVDATDQLLSERHLFGMAHTFADFNGDGSLDCYAIGMSSTTARRLDRLGLGRDDRPDVHQMRAAMGYGNRMYLWNGTRFDDPAFAAQVARTGWSWGTTSFDFDLDGDRDIYVANGFRSGSSCKDYCTTFWRHDIYAGKSAPSKNLEAFFAQTMRELDQGEISWNGFEHNALLLNDAGRSFSNVGFLFDIGFEYDARAVIGADLDLDGQPDLIVTEYKFVGQGFETVLHVYQNVMTLDRHWIGVHLRSNQPGTTPIGAKAVIHTPTSKQTGVLVTGDSFLSQHPATLHFGLGSESRVDRVEIIWPGGNTQVLDKPAVDRYHVVTPPRS